MLMTAEEAIQWLRRDIDMMKLDPITGKEAFLNEDDKHLLAAKEMAIEALTEQPKRLLNESEE